MIILDFFIAFFGGLFYLCKIVYDKTIIQREEKKFQDYSRYDDAIRANIEASYELSESIKQKLIKTPKNDMIDELKDDLMFVYGENYKSVCKYVPYYWAYNLLLSRLGKVDDEAFMFGFRIGGKDTFQEDIKFCQRIERNLDDHNVGLKLFLKPKYSPYTKSYDYEPYYKDMVFEYKLFDPQLGKRLW